METNNKLREALAEILGIADHVQMRFEIPKLANQEISELKQIAEAALAEPIKNCEVGTADDWLARFSVVCERCSGSDCDHRLFKEEEVCDCFARWLQMPYKEGGAK